MTLETITARLVHRLNRRFLDLSGELADARLPAGVPGETTMLYLHIPFCVVLCPFCSFHRVQFRDALARQYFDGLRTEVQRVADRGYSFDELYVGGGTPTVLPGELARTIVDIRAAHPLRGVSVETNPDDLKPAILDQLVGAGVNRLSVGVQSFDDALLREMQRYEKYGSGKQLATRLKTVNGRFDTVNIDMIFNLPHQSEQSLRHDLDVLVDDIGAEQVSFYPLMVSGTTRETLQAAMGEVDYVREQAYYEIIAQRMLAAGYERTSAWCFSRKAGMFDEYIVDRDDYVGLGSGAFSYLQGTLYASTFAISHYLRQVRAGGTGELRSRRLATRDRMRYHLLLRLFGGSLDLGAADALFDGHFRRRLWPELAALRAVGAVRRSGDVLTLTESGHYLWVVLMRDFFSNVNSLREEMRHFVAGADS